MLVFEPEMGRGTFFSFFRRFRLEQRGMFHKFVPVKPQEARLWASFASSA
jgi:hypothetical protein